MYSQQLNNRLQLEQALLAERQRLVSLPFLVKDTLAADVDALGLIYFASAVGSLVAPLWLGRATHLRHRGVLAYGASLLSGAAALAFGLPIGLISLLTMALINGAGITVFSLIWINTLQELVPRERLGRVISIDMLGSFVLLPIGYGVAGVATDAFGAATVFVIRGALTVALIGAGLLHPAVQGLD